MTEHALRAAAHVIIDTDPIRPQIRVPVTDLSGNRSDGVLPAAMLECLRQPDLAQQPKTGLQKDLLLILVGIRIGVASSFLARPQPAPSLSPEESAGRFDQLFRLWQQLGPRVVDETLLSEAIARYPEAARALKSTFRRRQR